jgi:hypothetical protein
VTTFSKKENLLFQEEVLRVNLSARGEELRGHLATSRLFFK